MKIDHVHFYTRDALQTSNWLIRNMGFQFIDNYQDDCTHTTIIAHNCVWLLISSPKKDSSPVADYLNSHPPGVIDIAFAVNNLELILTKANYLGVKVLQSLQTYKKDRGILKWIKIAGWDSLQHTLIENSTDIPFARLLLDTKRVQAINTDISQDFSQPNSHKLYDTNILGIDHLVLNVAAGELTNAVAWYKSLFGFRIQQTFTIQTKRSGLYSQALVDPSHQVQFNINEPTSPDSQIQEFLDINQGAGIQHIALRSSNIFEIVAKMRSQGVSFLPVPSAYYHQLKQRYSNLAGSALAEWEWKALETEQILVDWHENRPKSLLMQIFTQPIFNQPTFFWELIERRKQAQGFGEGNFKALFAAVEHEQMKRSYLVTMDKCQ